MATPKTCDALANRYAQTRAFTERLCETLTAEDCAIQSMPDASPTRWHLAHTTWFFEQFVLLPLGGYSAFDAAFAKLFNSYYNALGQPFPRDQRGMLSRPSFSEVVAYRQHVDRAMGNALTRDDATSIDRSIIELGIQHEQQHQELLLTDIKHAFSCNPLEPVYRCDPCSMASSPGELQWRPFDEGVYPIGYDADGFAFDNEGPRHRVFLEKFSLASRLTTNGEFCQFIADGGYRRPELWLSAGWRHVVDHGWQAPLYWRSLGGEPNQEFTLAGRSPLDPHRPVCHVSYFEADAYARWSNARLATEAEWEVAAQSLEPRGAQGRFSDLLLASGEAIHPQGCSPNADVAHTPKASSQASCATPLKQMWGDAWEWTASPYVPYPGYRPAVGALGEYNGKFMCNQFVLRGGSCATPSSHIRATYRNFFPPEARWQFSSIRLAK